MKIVYIAPLILLLLSCDQIDNRERSVLSAPDGDQVRLARTLPLENRYNLYLRQYNSRIPSDPKFAESFALDGRASVDFMMAKINEGNMSTFSSAMPIMYAIQSNGSYDICSDTDVMERLRRDIDAADPSEDQRRALLEDLNGLCEVRPRSP